VTFTGPYLTAIILAAVAGAALLFIFSFPSMQNVVTLIVGIAWPITILIVALIFRAELIGLLGRIIKIGKEGAEFEPSQALAPKGDPTSPGPIISAPPGGRPPSPPSAQDEGQGKLSAENAVAPVYREMFLEIFRQAKERLPLIRNQFSDTDTDIAIASFAEVSTALHLERASRAIFQSQIDALDALKYKVRTKNDFKSFYDKAARSQPSVYTNYSFDQWFNFLISWRLVTGPDDAIKVTAAGEAISMYMGEQHYKPMAA